VWQILSNVNPIGGTEKVEAVKDIIRKNKSEVANVIYFGDSITDSAPLKYVRENGGVAVSFNGNEYAVREAEFAVLSENTLVTTILATTFSKGGKNAVERLVSKWSFKAIEEFTGTNLRIKAEAIYRLGLPQIEIVTENNIERVTEKSCQFRIKVRGGAVGRLG
jgi:energy-converting hydrogenase A subunit R